MYYLDFNSTSPLANSVLKLLREGEVDFLNPSSQHTIGKKSKIIFERVKDFLLRSFSLENDYDLFFHSGTTQGFNAILKGYALNHCLEKWNYIFSSADHSCVTEQLSFLEKNFPLATIHSIDLKKDGEYNTDYWKNLLSGCDEKIFLNWTWVNSETGILGPDILTEMKKENVFVHIDATQAVGKVYNFQKIPFEADAISFSGHKFGSLKGIGWTFIKKKSSSMVASLSHGGNQQYFSSGTINTLGVLSLELALKEILQKQNEKIGECEKFRNFFESCLEKELKSIYFLKPQKRSCNTALMVHQKMKSELLSALFDLQDIYVSAGSACSSGSHLANRYLISCGNKEQALNTIRFSFDPNGDYFTSEKLIKKIIKILQAIDE